MTKKRMSFIATRDTGLLMDSRMLDGWFSRNWRQLTKIKGLLISLNVKTSTNVEFPISISIP